MLPPFPSGAARKAWSSPGLRGPARSAGSAGRRADLPRRRSRRGHPRPQPRPLLQAARPRRPAPLPDQRPGDALSHPRGAGDGAAGAQAARPVPRRAARRAAAGPRPSRRRRRAGGAAGPPAAGAADRRRHQPGELVPGRPRPVRRQRRDHPRLLHRLPHPHPRLQLHVPAQQHRQPARQSVRLRVPGEQGRGLGLRRAERGAPELHLGELGLHHPAGLDDLAEPHLHAARPGRLRTEPAGHLPRPLRHHLGERRQRRQQLHGRGRRDLGRLGAARGDAHLQRLRLAEHGEVPVRQRRGGRAVRLDGLHPHEPDSRRCGACSTWIRPRSTGTWTA